MIKELYRLYRFHMYVVYVLLVSLIPQLSRIIFIVCLNEYIIHYFTSEFIKIYTFVFPCFREYEKIDSN